MTLFFPDQVDFGDVEGMSFWLAGHYYEHRAMLQKALTLTPPWQVPDYNLYIWSPVSQILTRDWLQTHEWVHESLRQLTGISGPDLSEIDWQNKDEFDNWMLNHASEHALLRQVFGLP